MSTRLKSKFSLMSKEGNPWDLKRHSSPSVLQIYEEEAVDPPPMLNCISYSIWEYVFICFAASFVPDGRGSPQRTVHGLTIREKSKKVNLAFSLWWMTCLMLCAACLHSCLISVWWTEIICWMLKKKRSRIIIKYPPDSIFTSSVNLRSVRSESFQGSFHQQLLKSSIKGNLSHPFCFHTCFSLKQEGDEDSGI